MPGRVFNAFRAAKINSAGLPKPTVLPKPAIRTSTPWDTVRQTMPKPAMPSQTTWSSTKEILRESAPMFVGGTASIVLGGTILEHLKTVKNETVKETHGGDSIVSSTDRAVENSADSAMQAVRTMGRGPVKQEIKEDVARTGFEKSVDSVSTSHSSTGNIQSSSGGNGQTMSTEVFNVPPKGGGTAMLSIENLKSAYISLSTLEILSVVLASLVLLVIVSWVSMFIFAKLAKTNPKLLEDVQAIHKVGPARTVFILAVGFLSQLLWAVAWPAFSYATGAGVTSSMILIGVCIGIGAIYTLYYTRSGGQN